MKYFRVLAVVGIVLITGFGIRPLRAGLAESRVALERLQKEKTEKVGELSRLQQLLSAKDSSARLASALPTGRHQAEFLADLINVLRTAELSVSTITFMETFDSSVGATRMSARFRLEGSFQQLYSFLKAIEVLPRFTALENFDISTKEKDGALLASLSATVYTFFVPES